MSPTVKIRKARPSDLDALLAIEYSSFRHDRLSRRAMRHALASTSQVLFAALIDGVVIGYACLHGKKNQAIARLYSIAVLQSYRGRGAASLLLNRCARQCRKLGFEIMGLEARAEDTALINFYTRHGFSPVALKPNYYEDGADALKMQKSLVAQRGRKVVDPRRKLLLVVPRSQDRAAVQPLTEHFRSAQVLTAREFLSTPSFLGESVRVINLCPADEYLASGYYVSLIAEARGNKTFADIDSLSGLVSRKLYLRYLDELNRLLPPYDVLAAHIKGDEKKFSLEFYFGQTDCDWARRLCRRCYSLFAVPILEVQLIYKKRRWQVDYIWPLSISSVDDKDRPRFISAARLALATRLPHPVLAKSASFDLAILVEKEEALPPSNSRALAQFVKTAASLNMQAEIITRDDFSRLSSFDALFIRTTTQIDHYSYRFATQAERLGLPVIDDPQSILRCSNKVFLTEALTRAAVDMPQSWLVTRSNMQKLVQEMSYPLVLKIPDGSFSRGMHKVKTADEFIFRASEMLKQSFVILAQEFMPSDFDWRIGVLNGQPLFACKYYMSRGHWQIYNHKTGGRVTSGGFDAVSLEDVPETVLSTAVRASLVIGQGLYGVDLKLIDGQARIIEVNDNPNIDFGVEDLLAGQSVYNAIMELLRARIVASKGLASSAI